MDYLLHDQTEVLRLVSDDGSFTGPGLSWRERDGVWICDGAYSYRCPHNEFSCGPEQLAKVSAALNG